MVVRLNKMSRVRTRSIFAHTPAPAPTAHSPAKLATNARMKNAALLTLIATGCMLSSCVGRSVGDESKIHTGRSHVAANTESARRLRLLCARRENSAAARPAEGARWHVYLSFSFPLSLIFHWKNRQLDGP